MIRSLMLSSVVAALFLVASGCGGKGSPSGSTDGPPGGDTGEMPTGWVTVTIPEGSSKIKMPGQPERTETVKDGGGATYVYVFKDKKDIVYVVSLSSAPTDEEWAARESTFNLQGARDEVLETLKSTPIAEKAIDYHGHLGFEIVGLDRQSELFVRVRHFQIAVQKHPQTFNVLMMSRKREDLASNEAEAYFRSFQVLKEVAKGPVVPRLGETNGTSTSGVDVVSPIGNSGTAAAAPAEGALFNGTNLTGWVGEAGVWTVQDGAIVGSSFPSGRQDNTFLCTEREYRDFELDFDAKLEGNNNSGVMIRSKLVDVDKNLTSGIKVDLGGNQTGLGGLVTYDGRSGRILRPVGRGSATVHADDFNHVQIKCVGKRVTVTVNGAQVQDTDLPELEPSGVISFHLRHGNPMSIAFKNIRIREVR